MSQTIKIYGYKSAIISKATGSEDFNEHSSSVYAMDYRERMVIGFKIPSEYTAYHIEAISLGMFVVPTGNWSKFKVIPVFASSAGWDESTVTWRTKPLSADSYDEDSPFAYVPGCYETVGSSQWWYLSTGLEIADVTFEIEPYLNSNYSGSQGSVYTTRASQSEQPYLLLTLSDEKAHYVPSVSPDSGYVPKKQDTTFNFGYTLTAIPINTISVTDIVFRYRLSASSSYTEVDCGTNTSYTVPAGTFTTDAPQVQIQITDSGGTTTTSEWYTLSTVEALPTAVCVQPKNTVIDGSAASTFEWEHIIATGTQPTQSDLQESEDGSTWLTLKTVSGSDTSATLPAGTFEAGEWYWRVRTYNTDNTAGEWSDAVAFSVVAAPSTPTVTVDNTPRPTVKWQSSGQQGYQIVVLDGSGSTVYDSNTVYGTASSQKLPMYLDDGNYTIKVRVQNEYGLWSEYGAAGIVVANTTTATITLTVETDEAVAELNWTVANASFSAYLVYRNDELIAKVSTKAYKDLKGCGDTTYKVRGIYSGNDGYGMSNAVMVSLLPSCLVISQDGSEEYVKLDLNTSQYAETNRTDSASYVSTHIYGSAYPMIEISSFRSKSISFSCAFTKTDERNSEFAALIGNIVTLKTPQGSMVTGLLSSLTTRESQFYIAYSASVAQIDDSAEVTI